MYKMARKKKSALSYLTNILEDGLFVATAAYIHAKESKDSYMLEVLQKDAETFTKPWAKICKIRNGYLTYSFNLGGKTVSLESSETVPMEALTTVEIKRDGRYGEMSVNGQGVGSVTSEGDMEQLSVGTELYIGGYIEDEMPTSEVQDTNFAGKNS